MTKTNNNNESVHLSQRITDGEVVYVVDRIEMTNVSSKAHRSMTLEAFNAMSFKVYQPSPIELENERLQAIIEEKNKLIAELQASKVPDVSKTKHKSGGVKVGQLTPTGRIRRENMTVNDKRVFNRFVTQGMKSKDLAERFNINYNYACTLRNEYLRRKEQDNTKELA